MGWTSKLLALAVTGALGAQAFEASIFKLPSEQRHNDNPSTVSEDVARAILELRLESSQASVLGGVDTDTVERLNQLSGAQSALFGGFNGAEAPKKSLLILEGFGHQVGSNMRMAQPGGLHVPTTSRDLVDELVESLTSTTKGHSCSYRRDNVDGKTTDTQSLKKCLSTDPLLVGEHDLLNSDTLARVHQAEVWVDDARINSVSKLTFAPNSDNDAGSPLRLSLESTLQSLSRSSTDESREATAVFLTSSEHDLPVSKKVMQRNVGSLERPSSPHRIASELSGRASQGLPLHSNLAPVCHVSNSSCAEATNNCSGHGYCHLKYGSGEESASGNCYSCKCQETVVRKSDGTVQKTQWGGPACQKQDISSPFFLIAGVSIFAVALIASAIGLLFSMGQQELPGIISAGVAGSKPPA